MRKTISATLLALFIVSMSCVSCAMTVSVKDKDGFEIDVFNAGETAVITAQVREQPYITIIGSNAQVSRQKMEEIPSGETDADSGIYTYSFVPKQEGEYAVEVESGKELQDLTIFAANGINLDWNNLSVENVNQGEPKIVQPKQKEQERSQNQVLIVSENGTERIIYDDVRTGFFDSCLGFLKKLEGILNG